ncbi:MFS transporter [Altererythrobacter sp. GH1-8]|uniref:MFS transporter n=1 Tax=Altererythrobacter sp. GH1-8 TaxID=3349333 RepID=UPI00374D8956
MSDPNHPGSELSRGATILLACTVGMMLGLSAIPFYTLGVFAEPVTNATGWSMAEFQFQFTCVSIGVLAAPIHGLLIDRLDPRKVVLTSILLFGLAVVLAGWMAMVSLFAFYASWLVAALVGQSTGPVGWTKFVTGWFDKQRGLALGIALSGSGIFAFVGPVVSEVLIAEIGWQQAYMALGAAILAINLPIALLFLRNPPTHCAVEKAPAAKFAWRTCLADFRFALITVAFALLGFAVSGVISNLVPILQTNGIERTSAAAMAGLVGISVLFARIVVGLLLDRFWPPLIAAVSMSLPAISCLTLAGQFELPIALAIILIGFCAGAEFDILAYLVSRHFPEEAYGRIYSVTYMAMIAGAGIAPPVFGNNLDRFGDYSQILYVSAAIFVIAPLSLLFLRNPTGLLRTD